MVLNVSTEMNLFLPQFSSDYNFPPYNEAPTCYAIASTPRSGSHMLGHILHSFKQFGYPLEYLHPKNLAKWKSSLGTSTTEETISALKKIRTSPNGLFGGKIHSEHVSKAGGFTELEKLFPRCKYILLTRSRVLDQAVSYEIASQTGVWISGQQSKSTTVSYDFHRIKKKLLSILRDNSNWRLLFSIFQAPHIEVSYESLLSNRESVLAAIAQFLDVNISSIPPAEKTTTQKQGGEINIEWVERFRLEAQRRQDPELLGPN